MPSKVIKATRSYLRSLAKGKIPTAASTSSNEIRRFSAGRGLCEEVETVLSLLERLESKEGIVKVQATTPSKSIDKDLSKVTSCSTAPAENQKDPKRQLDN
ncbi:hypothetical protein I302_109074 [Kwoniella bestiolae CBS 10118]|uniref:Uncharacterized protein n=1 Tax=Kwoniella bestiolae CBS 10118 TaxID=1296100 RepID=A0A1B9FUX9_9TREE|nr:hypothetical protein I302_08218 [Kwoniella bestiolae CBS 10118]OCF22568.1 hypothetical protein I302_08218 [Kwoniella bestiolae CBS 10118]